MLFDTHAHYDDRRFNEDRDALLASLPENGVTLVVNAGASEKSSAQSLELADRFPFVYATVGVHPHDAEDMDEGSISRLEAMLRHPKAVAVGEIGLDYYYDNSPRDVQKQRFYDQLALAQAVKKPVVIHERDATADTLDIIRAIPDATGVFHCYSGSWETAKWLLSRGWHLSFGGVITFKNARRACEVVARMPLDRLLLETDCPYLTPEPYRGKRNSSLYLYRVAERAGELKGLSLEQIAEKTTENGKRVFGIE
jgi:TatD DNase family protein